MKESKQRIPLHHSIIKGLSYFWPLGIIPGGVAFFKTDSLVWCVCAAFFVNSLLTALFYWEDKYLAQYNYWRIPEKVLHIWEFLCGWPGALYAQRAFKHKRCKTSFLIVFWLCVVGNVLALFLLWRLLSRG